MAFLTRDGERAFADHVIEAWFEQMEKTIRRHDSFTMPGQVLEIRRVPGSELNVKRGQWIALHLRYFTSPIEGVEPWQREITEFPSWPDTDEPEIPPV